MVSFVVELTRSSYQAGVEVVGRAALARCVALALTGICGVPPGIGGNTDTMFEWTRRAASWGSWTDHLGRVVVVAMAGLLLSAPVAATTDVAGEDASDQATPPEGSVLIDTDDSTPEAGTELTAGETVEFEVQIQYTLPDGVAGSIEIYFPDAGGQAEAVEVTGSGESQTVTRRYEREIPGGDAVDDSFGVSVILRSASGEPIEADDVSYPVSAAGSPPTIDGASPSGGVAEVAAGDSVVFSVDPSDPDSDQLTFTWYVDYKGDSTGLEEVQSGSGNSYTHTFQEAGDYVVRVEVSDVANTVDKSWTVGVSGDGGGEGADKSDTGGSGAGDTGDAESQTGVLEVQLDRSTDDEPSSLTYVLYAVRDDGRWDEIESKTAGSDGVASWDGLEVGTYAVEVYSDEEFWGGAQGTVTDEETRSISIPRSTPRVTEVDVTDDKRGNGDGTFEVGETLTISPKVVSGESNPVETRARIYVSRDEQGEGTVRGPVEIPGSGEQWFGLDFTPSEAGTYYVRVVVESKYGDEFAVTDDTGWETSFQVGSTGGGNQDSGSQDGGQRDGGSSDGEARDGTSNVRGDSVRIIAGFDTQYGILLDRTLNARWWRSVSREQARKVQKGVMTRELKVSIMLLKKIIPTNTIADSIVEITGRVSALFQSFHTYHVAAAMESGRYDRLRGNLVELRENGEEIENANTVERKRALFEARRRLLRETYRTLYTYENDVYHTTIANNPTNALPAPSGAKLDGGEYVTIRGQLERLRLYLVADYLATTSWLKNGESNEQLALATNIQMPPRRTEVSPRMASYFDTLDTDDDYAIYRIHISDSQDNKGLNVQFKTPDSENVSAFYSPTKPNDVDDPSGEPLRGSSNGKELTVTDPAAGDHYILVKGDRPLPYHLGVQAFREGLLIGWDKSQPEELRQVETGFGQRTNKPYPDPSISEIQVTPGSGVSEGTPVTIEIVVENRGGTADWQSIAVSFPNVSDSNSIEVVDHDLDRVRVATAGDEVGSTYGTETTKVDYPLVEGDVSRWNSGEEHHMTVRVQPDHEGRFVAYVKSISRGAGVWKMAPEIAGTSAVDQQSEYVLQREIQVRASDVTDSPEGRQSGDRSGDDEGQSNELAPGDSDTPTSPGIGGGGPDITETDLPGADVSDTPIQPGDSPGSTPKADDSTPGPTADDVTPGSGGTPTDGMQVPDITTIGDGAPEGGIGQDDGGSDTTPAPGQPGFGATLAILAVFALALLARRRRD